MNDALTTTDIFPYSDEYKERMVELLEEFYQYLLHIDPLNRLLIKPGYGEAELKKILKEIQASEGIFYIAVTNHEIAGFVTAIIYRPTPDDLLGVIPSSSGRVTNLYVSALNRQQGLGSTLLQKAEEYVKSKDCDAMNIEVFVPNEPARSFYQKMGYEARKIDQIKKL